MKRPRRSKVLLLIPHLGGGGAERVMEILARSLDPQKFDVHLCLVTESGPPTSKFGPFVTVHRLSSTRVRYGIYKLLRLIWRVKPDAILSGIAHLNVLSLMLRPLLPQRTRILVRQNGELSAMVTSPLHGRCLRRIFGLAYRRADRIICQTDAMAAEIQEQLHVLSRRLIVLRNPIAMNRPTTSHPTIRSPWMGPGPRILTIGRLVPEKGFDLLLDAFAIISSQHPAAELVVAGSGKCEAELKRQAIALGIGARVRFIGYQENLTALFDRATLFVLSSRTEGLPNALLESAAAGLPIVVTPACRGLVDLLRDKEGTWIASETSSAALCSALEKALSSILPGQRYRHSWIDVFDRSCAVPAYEDAIDGVIQESA